MDEKTIQVYDAKVSDYEQLVSRDVPDKHLRQFLDALSAKSHILDLGCGPGNSAAMMMSKGHSVDAVDASSEMVRVAQGKFGVKARQARFDQIDGQDIYDGIWANFSLLHADKIGFPEHLKALHTALKPGGVFHIGMKLGKGAARDKIGRLYSYYSEDELTKLLTDAGFTITAKDLGEGAGLSGEIAPFIILLAHG